jgi:alkylation response protein AidB-like acyl-CoA dehydrogenase
VYEVGRACDRATPESVRHFRKDAAGAILFASERATWMAGEAIQALGGNGYINDYPTGRLWREPSCKSGGTSDQKDADRSRAFLRHHVGLAACIPGSSNSSNH